LRKIKAKKSKTVNEKTLIATVDIGKTTNMGYWRTPSGAEAKPFEFPNNRQGFNTFWQHIAKAKEFHNLDEMVVGFESTGCYGEPLVHFLRSKKVRLVQVNPMHTKRVKEIQGNSPNKTDQKDPKVMADIIGLNCALTLVIPEGPAAELRRLTQARERWIKQRTALFNNLQHLVFIVFPEFLQVMKDVKTKSARCLLEHWPTPESIVKYGLLSLTRILKKISYGKMGEERALALYNAARTSVGVKDGRDSIVFEIRQILASIKQLQQFIAEAERRMSDHLTQIPYSSYILSLKGIGEITTAGLIGEVGDFTKFNTISEMMKLAGLDLFEISSGKHKGKRRISKRGRSFLRKLLYFAAINTVRKGGIMHGYYQSHLERGMIKMKALIAVARKLLGIIFALVRDHSEYVSDYIKPQNLSLKEAA
jgi:transposase